MTDYLYNDIFIKQKVFKTFLNMGQRMDSSFLYDLSFGFLPRKFGTSERDRYIYEVGQDVTEMYFLIEGSWAICFDAGNGMYVKEQLLKEKLNDPRNFSVFDNGMMKAKEWLKPNYIGDYYCINSKKARYYYLAWDSPV
jgi:hypothetical protein